MSFGVGRMSGTPQMAHMVCSVPRRSFERCIISGEMFVLGPMDLSGSGSALRRALRLPVTVTHPGISGLHRRFYFKKTVECRRYTQAVL
jgi:hypothetical protein